MAYRFKEDKNNSIQNCMFFLLPFFVFYIVFTLIPLFQAVYMSLFNWDLLSPDTKQFVGLDNYKNLFTITGWKWSFTHLLVLRLLGVLFTLVLWYFSRRAKKEEKSRRILITIFLLFFIFVLGFHTGKADLVFSDAVFWIAFGNTLTFVFLSTLPNVVLGLIFALWVNKKTKIATIFRVVLFTPNVLSVAVVALIWSFVLNPQIGILAKALSYFGVEPIVWLASSKLAMPAIVIVTLWWTAGFNMLLFLAGLQDINPDLYEASQLDGAGRLKQFLHITAPGLYRPFVTVFVLQIIASFKIFGQVFILTRGGPGGRTRVLIQYIYETGFRNFQLGMAAAISLFLLVIIVAVSYLQFYLSAKKEKI